MGHSRQSRLNLAAFLIAAAIVARALVPVGWMPAPTHGGIRVMLCSGKGTIELPVRAAEYDESAPGRSHGGTELHDPCPFGAALGKAIDQPARMDVAGTGFVVPPEMGPQPLTARLVPVRGLRPPARGPPRFA